VLSIFSHSKLLCFPVTFFYQKESNQNKRSAFAKQNVSSKEMTPIKVDTAPTGYPPVLIYSRELRDFSTLGQVLALFP
ncbi:MAG: hypothetical protein LBQ18_08760, partial [Campylobacteraceae bacterium]|nr:hypothetical protein [Campylobacteraceae bacterium]